MTAWIGGLALAGFFVGAIEALGRGGGAGCVASGGLVAVTVAIVTVIYIAVTAAVRRGLPPGLRAGPWAAGAVAGMIVFLALLGPAAGFLAGNYRDPALVALTAAVFGVGAAMFGGIVGPPLVALVAATASRMRGRARPWSLRTARWGGVVAVGVGLVAAVDLAGQRRPQAPAGLLAARTVLWVQALTDVDGDGTGALLQPRDCAPLDPAVDGRACARRGGP